MQYREVDTSSSSALEEKGYADRIAHRLLPPML